MRKLRKKIRKYKKKISLKYKKKVFLLNRRHLFRRQKRFFKQYSYVKNWIKRKMRKTKQLRSTYFRRMKEHSNLIAYKNKKNIRINSFTEHLLESLTNFIGKKYSIFITLKNLKVNNLKDSYLKPDAIFLKKKLHLKLYQYRRSEFFKTAKRIIFISIRRKNSAQFLANFISSQLNRLKKQQKFFLNFIKSIFKLLLEKAITSTKLLGIKIIVKGRLNKARRAKGRTFKILIGKVPLQHIDSSIDHAKATSYTSNGTFGTEVWINYLRTPNRKKVSKSLISTTTLKKKIVF